MLIFWFNCSVSNHNGAKTFKLHIHCRHNITHTKEFSGNQGKHQNFNPSILPYKFGLISMGMKQKKYFFFEKKNQNGRLKKSSFFKITNSQNFFAKISHFGPWVSRIDWCQGHWYGLNYMVVRQSDISSKTGKNRVFCVFRLFLSLCQTASRPYSLSHTLCPSHQSILLT